MGDGSAIARGNDRAEFSAGSVEPARYRDLVLIGRGSMGVVYRARDTVLDRNVALKTLRSPAPDELYLLKKEFRSLSNLSHPNLVQLHDLVAVDDQCFFTMELIDGVDLVRFVRRDDADAGESKTSPKVDYDCLRDSIYQLVVGLHALHSYGKIHRDVKPANILVERSGRVVLLDFGLASGVEPGDSDDSVAGSLAGTLMYMAPEQAWGLEISPAADWYSVGVVLYEALTGKAPFSGSPLAAALERRRSMPPHPRSLAPETPADLDGLTMDLLQTAAEARPSGQQLLARLESRRRDWSAVPGPQDVAAEDALFVGRKPELAALRAAFNETRQGGLVTVCVSGLSGIGKTSLLEHFLSTLPGKESVIALRARCHPQESIPFKAVDAAIDDLARFLARQTDDAVQAFLPRDIAALARIFPVLGRIQPIAAALGHEAVGREPQEIRRRAFASLRELVARIGDHHPIVLWIDDFQWGDLDSVALLRTLRNPVDSPGLLLLLSFRDGEQQSTAVGRLFADDEAQSDTPPPARHLEVAPLSEREAIELARQMIATLGAGADEQEVAAIARESGGSPFFARELARHLGARRAAAPDTRVALGVSALLAQRVAELPENDRHFLDVVSVAGAPLQEELVHRIGDGGDDVTRILARLRSQHLLRASMTDDQPAVDTYHDRIRETVVGLLSIETYHSLHLRIATVLESFPNPDPQRLIEHYLQADELTRAGEHAFSSAERAAEALAFEQASRLYRRALELEAHARPRWVLHAKLAAMLVNMGRGGEAAGEYVAAAAELAAREARNPEVWRLKRQAAEHYMQCGMYDEGLAVLREVLSSVGLRYVTSTNRVILSLIANRARLRLGELLPSRAPKRVPRRDRQRLEVCWSAGVGLGVFDTLRAADFQVRHALLARRVGDPAHRARALAIEALLMVWEGGERKRRRASQLRVESERLALATGDPNIEAYALVLRAVAAFFERRFREAITVADRAEALCRDKCVGVAWELANAQTIGIYARVLMGDLQNLLQRVGVTLREARERGDQYGLFMGRLGHANMVWLAMDDPDEASRQVDDALAQEFPSTFTWPAYQGALAQAQIDLYRGDGTAGTQRMEAAWAELRAGSMLRLQPVRIEMRELRARAAIMAAAEPGCDRADKRKLLRFAADEARRLAREDVPWVTPFVAALNGEIAAASGEMPKAIDLLEGAALGFEHAEMALHAAALRWHLAAHLPGASQRRADLETWMQEHGVRNPARMAALLAPGIEAA